MIPKLPPSDGRDDGVTDWKEQYHVDFGEATMMDYPDLSWEQRWKCRWLELYGDEIREKLAENDRYKAIKEKKVKALRRKSGI